MADAHETYQLIWDMGNIITDDVARRRVAYYYVSSFFSRSALLRDGAPPLLMPLVRRCRSRSSATFTSAATTR